MSVKSQILHNIKNSLNESEEEHKFINEKLEFDTQLLNAFLNIRRDIDSLANRLSAPRFPMPGLDQQKTDQDYEVKKALKKRLGKKAMEQLSLLEDLILEKFGLEKKQKSNKVRSPFGGDVDIGDEEVDDTFDRFDNDDDEE